MTSDTDVQNPDTKVAQSSFATNEHNTSSASEFTDYMQLCTAAQWLKFPAKIESEFKTYYYNSTIKITRWAFIAGFLIYSLFGYLDIYVTPISLRQVWLIRYGIGCPMLLLVVAFSYFKKLAPVMQLVGGVAATIGGLGIVAIIMITRPEEVANSHYYSGLLLVMLFTSSWLRLRFWYALVTNTIVIIAYEIVAIYVQHLLAEPQGQVQFLSNNFLLLGTYFIGAFANYSLERHTRIDFLQKRTIEVEKNKVSAQRYAIEQQANELSKVVASLKEAQTRLVTSEKLASLGELTAGIAHEIKNPLNFVTNFSEVNMELFNDFEHEVKAGNVQESLALANNIKDNLEKIVYHGNRADLIVKSMFQHSSKGTGLKQPTDINVLIDDYLRLSYQGLRAKDKNFNCKIQEDLDNTIGTINIVSQDIGRVVLNLFTNAFYSVNKKQKLSNEAYEPTVYVSTKKVVGVSDGIIIKIRDNGLGISESNLKKIFQPFFTTKPSGEGIGLGLSLSHDIIVKGHNGSLKVKSKEGEFAEFIVELPC